MSFIKPTLSAEDFETSTNENFGKIVPVGTYQMTIGKVAVIRRSKTNPVNQYLNVQLNHTGEWAGASPAFAMIMATGVKADGSNIKLGKLAKFLAAVGITATDEYALDFLDEGESEKAIAIDVRGDTVALQGRTVTAQLEEEEYNGKTKNTVAFIVPAE